MCQNICFNKSMPLLKILDISQVLEPTKSKKVRGMLQLYLINKQTEEKDIYIVAENKFNDLGFHVDPA